MATNRILVFAPDDPVMKWVEAEVKGASLQLQMARAAREIVHALVDDPPPRPQILVLDFDALSPGDVLGIHAIRERGWFGIVIALGAVSDDLRASLNIERVLMRPLTTGALRKAVSEVGLDRATMRIPKVRR